MPKDTNEALPGTIPRSPVKAQRTREELNQRAKSLGVTGRSKMTKLELGQAIARRQD